MGAMGQERAEPFGSSPGQRTSLYVATSAKGPHEMPVRLPERQDNPDDGVKAFSCLQDLKIRLIWLALSGIL
jgi:hypothetical protein